jgi:hypothetical protein
MNCNLCNRLGPEEVCHMCFEQPTEVVIFETKIRNNFDNVDKIKLTETGIKKARHHGDTGTRIKPVDVGTDYFCFECPLCSNDDERHFMFPFRIRQCKGEGHDGRLIINIACETCGFSDARKLWGIDHFRKTRVEVCDHDKKRGIKK